MDLSQSQRSGHYPYPSVTGSPFEAPIYGDCDQLGKEHSSPSNNINNMCDIINNKNKLTLSHENLCTTISSPMPGNAATSLMLMPPTTTDTVTEDLCDLVVTQSPTALVQKIFPQDDYNFWLDEHNPRISGLRIFATIMLNAWRMRRDEVKRLTNELSDLKRGSNKAKNQLHVFNTLFRVEQKRNDNLSGQLKRSLEEKMQAKSSCEVLTASVMSLRTDSALLEQQLKSKEQEFEALNTILSETQSELFKAMTQQRTLQADLSMEQRKVQSLENQKNELINEICDLSNEARQKEEKFQAQLQAKNEELATTAEESRQFETLFIKLKEYQLQIDDFSSIQMKYEANIDALRTEIADLKYGLVTTFAYRIKTYWQIPAVFRRITLHLIHWVIYYLLPAIPTPRPPCLFLTLTLQRPFSIVKR